MRLTSTGPVETKVQAATVAAVTSGLIVWALQVFVFRGALPGPVDGAVQVLVPAAFALAAGWWARHTPRPDLDERGDHALDGDPGEIPATDLLRPEP